MRTREQLNSASQGTLPGLVGLVVTSVEPGLLRASMPVRPDLLAPNGYLHAASVIALADTACGYGTMADLDEDAKGFTTIELKSNFLGTATEGEIYCEATRAHRGRSTQVWDAVVRNSAGKQLALFRCTQIILR